MRPLVGGYVGLGVGLVLGLCVGAPNVLRRCAIPLVGVGASWAFISLATVLVYLTRSSMSGLAFLAVLGAIVPVMLTVAGVALWRNLGPWWGLLIAATVVAGLSVAPRLLAVGVNTVTHAETLFYLAFYAFRMPLALIGPFGPVMLTAAILALGRDDPYRYAEGEHEAAPRVTHARHRGQF
jgi:hypothetical protein